MSSSWIRQAMGVLAAIEDTQQEAIDEASRRAAAAIGGGGVVFTFGTGHSRIPVEEMFPRYGSYPGFLPLVELSTTFYTQVAGANGMRQAMFIENVEGLAEKILANYAPRPTDAAIVFSAGGLNAVPVELATGLRKAGVFVVAVTSMAETSAGEPRHSGGTRLCEAADLTIDLCTPLGDALCEVDGLGGPVGPSTTVAAVAVVNEIKVRTARLLTEAGHRPPVITSTRLVGSRQSEELFESAYLEHARRAAQVLRGAQ
ncbi:sugar isomerase domain-containing protein [Streptomyces sp. A7024]|uniref:Sugar isomerase domain-containing protein n=1 Tax=Streptomyces coryli TaxID=1128680 RepID=A0A6G4TS14_9ACTN|nr:sugar isomerase domain-containing protein [Streptomyces coryli]NGN62340.1 sugar isomerase domain-containing protein [Streptomyces coryli]